MYQIGQQVVCLSSDWVDRPIISPVEGGVYTIRGFLNDGDNFGFYFEEFINKKYNLRFSDSSIRKLEPAFNSKKFRPVKKTNIDIFHRILNNVPNKSEKV